MLCPITSIPHPRFLVSVSIVIVLSTNTFCSLTLSYVDHVRFRTYARPVRTCFCAHSTPPSYNLSVRVSYLMFHISYSPSRHRVPHIYRCFPSGLFLLLVSLVCCNITVTHCTDVLGLCLLLDWLFSAWVDVSLSCR